MTSRLPNKTPIQAKPIHDNISIGGSSVYQLSEMDNADLLLSKVESALMGRDELLPLMDDITCLDQVDLKRLMDKRGEQLLVELQNGVTNGWVKGLAIVIITLKLC
jgi:hypothetical protein